MNSWQELILEQFTPKVSRLTIVADPDGLLQEESVQAGIRDRGFELCLLEDHIAFRYIYESVFRSQWDKGEESELVVVVHSRFSDFQQLPFDIFASSRHLSFGLVELFPNLNYPVIASLEIENLDAVYKAQQEYAPKTLGRNGTIEFLLRHVFQIDGPAENRVGLCRCRSNDQEIRRRQMFHMLTCFNLSLLLS